MTQELQVLKEVTAVLELLEIPYMVTGSIAGNFYSEPRMTRDIDIVLVLKPSKIDQFVSSLKSVSYIDKDVVDEQVKTRGMFNLIHHKFFIKVDCVIRKDDEYRRVEFDRRQKVKVKDFFFWIVTLEDLILSKLFWAKDSQSEMQLRDVKNLIYDENRLDMPYLEKWIEKLDLNKNYQMAKQK